MTTHRHTVRPGVSSPIYLRTVAGAACLLYRADDNDPTRRLKLFADDDGIICLHARPAVEADHIAKFVHRVQCGRACYTPRTRFAIQPQRECRDAIPASGKAAAQGEPSDPTGF